MSGTFSRYWIQPIAPIAGRPVLPLYDLNGDGVMELLPGGKGSSVVEILSMRDGESYQYADFRKFIFLSDLYFTVCENHVLELRKQRTILPKYGTIFGRKPMG